MPLVQPQGRSPINVAPRFQYRLAVATEQAGGDLGLRCNGARAFMSLRLEKGWCVWSLHDRPEPSAADKGT